jgi:anti-anti-sigma factor
MGQSRSKAVLRCRAHGHTRVLSVEIPEVYQADAILQLSHQIRKAIEDAGPESRFILDLAAVRFLTSAAIGMMTNIHSHLKSRGYAFAVAGAAGEVATVIRTVRLGEVMPVFPTLKEALEDFRCC